MTERRLHVRRGLLLAVQLGISVLLLVLLWRTAGGADAVNALVQADHAWLLVALLLLVAHTVLSALRWRVAAAPLGITLSPAHATGEYFLAQLVNTALPGGVLGDAGRAARSRHQAGLGRAAGAVAVERAIGQCALLAVFGAGFVVTLTAPTDVEWPTGFAVGIAVGLTALCLVVASLLLGMRRTTGAADGRLGRLVDGVRRSVAAPGAARAHTVLSAGTTACILAAFACCIVAVGASLSLAAIVAVVPLVLWAMLLPISIGGWGVREGAAVALLPVAGVAATDALAASVAFGVVALVAAVPGLPVLWATRRADPPKTVAGSNHPASRHPSRVLPSEESP